MYGSDEGLSGACSQLATNLRCSGRGTRLLGVTPASRSLTLNNSKSSYITDVSTSAHYSGYASSSRELTQACVDRLLIKDQSEGGFKTIIPQRQLHLSHGN